MLIEVNPENEIHKYYMDTFSSLILPPTFRYFQTRKWSEIIYDHKLTLLYIVNDRPVGYAHIDFHKASNRYFFGICVLEEFQGKGIGKELMMYCLIKAQEKNINLFLTVDKQNEKAFFMYKKNGFKIIEEKLTYYLMKYEV